MSARKLSGLCAAALGLVLGTAAPAPATPLKVILPYSFLGALSGWTLAEADGCYRRNGLEVKLDAGAGSGDALSKTAAGAYEIGVADFAALVRFNAAQPGPGLIATYIMWDRAPTSVVTLKNTGIRGPRDLAGKNIGDTVGEASRELFPAFAAATGLDPASITWINITPNLRHIGLMRGEFAAAAGHMYTITNGLQSAGVREDDMVVMPYASYGVDLFGNSVIVKSVWADAHAALLKSFLVCAVDGMKGAMADPKAAIASLRPYNSLLDEAQADGDLAFSNRFSILTPNVRENGLSAVDPARLDKILAQISAAYEIPKPDAARIWTDAYLPPRQDRLLARP